VEMESKQMLSTTWILQRLWRDLRNVRYVDVIEILYAVPKGRLD
jgi:hypothetical protein